MEGAGCGSSIESPVFIHHDIRPFLYWTLNNSNKPITAIYLNLPYYNNVLLSDGVSKLIIVGNKYNHLKAG